LVRIQSINSLLYRFFTSRETNSQLSVKLLFNVSLSACVLSYIFALPFYLFVERPFKNFLNLILFPVGTKRKDVEDDDSEEEYEN
jgi:peptidoglycan/LPS O-acetylase OafA/YrhL